ncbi:MAG: acyl-CoA desaturase [Cellvibrionaceae bacterium]
MNSGVPRIKAIPGKDNAYTGDVRWSPIKSIWISVMYIATIIGGWLTFSWEALLLFLITCAVTLLGGHSLGMHRRLIHNSYECPLWLEYFLVYLGVLVGLAGPLGMIKTHDMRDWAQRQKRCHSYFGHKESFLKDWFWQIHCDIQLTAGPDFIPEARVAKDKIYDWMEKTWMWQQAPWIIIFGLIGGLDWIIWGICIRVTVCVTGHWLVGYFAHNDGDKHWHVEGAAVQGYNIKYLGLITMGECWHNNHHAFPGSAKLGLHKGETDPGWWILKLLEKIGLVWSIKLPEDLPDRAELKVVNRYHNKQCSSRKIIMKLLNQNGAVL